MSDKYKKLPRTAGMRNRKPLWKARECTTTLGVRKRAFRTLEDALESRGATEGHLRPYRCSVCKQYHLTKRGNE